MASRHKWQDIPHRSGDQRCSVCGKERTLVSNSRHRFGAGLGKHWEYWKKDDFGTLRVNKAGPCPGAKAEARHA